MHSISPTIQSGESPPERPVSPKIGLKLQMQDVQPRENSLVAELDDSGSVLVADPVEDGVSSDSFETDVGQDEESEQESLPTHWNESLVVYRVKNESHPSNSEVQEQNTNEEEICLESSPEHWQTESHPELDYF